MAKVVIAGKSDCPYYAKIELLADSLQKNADSFKVHKIVKNPEEWDEWLKQTCEERKFSYNKSPIVWRELVDRGGKGVLIGGANEFQEYAWGYYNVKLGLASSELQKIAKENVSYKEELDKEHKYFKSLSNPMKVCITNASSAVCYHMIDALARGNIFGSGVELSLYLLDSEENISYLEGTAMEAQDLACNELRNICVTCNAHQALTDCEVVVLLDQVQKDTEDAQETWLKKYTDLYVEQAKLIDQLCKTSVKVLLAGNGPVNIATQLMHQTVKNIEKRNIVAMPRLVENQAKAIIAQKVKVNSSDVVDVIVWGDQENYFCDVNQSRVHDHDGPIWGPPFYSRLMHLLVHEDSWIKKDFVESLQNRYSFEKAQLGKVPSTSQAAAITSLLKHWWEGSPDGQLYSLGVASEGWYDVPEGMVFNFPVTFNSPGCWEVSDKINLPEESKQRLKECIDYLNEQKYTLFPELRPQPPPSPEKPADLPTTADESAHPPPMTPIKEETDHDHDISKQSEQTTADEITEGVTDTENHTTEDGDKTETNVAPANSEPQPDHSADLVEQRETPTKGEPENVET